MKFSSSIPFLAQIFLSLGHEIIQRDECPASVITEYVTVSSTVYISNVPGGNTQQGYLPYTIGPASGGNGNVPGMTITVTETLSPVVITMTVTQTIPPIVITETHTKT
jgi:hypothetical protein